MIDENLPTFYLRSSSDDVKHNASILLSQFGSDALPAYSLRHPDPALPSSKNRYAVALYDSYNPEILFGEILLVPEWTQLTLNKEEIRLNGGIPPAPQPILPTEFVIQLYNPDQQVSVKWHSGSWSSTPYWGFEMPQQSFRQPSTSALDRTQSDPTASENTPKLGFKWKKDGKLSKDYVCSLSGKSTNPDGSKRKNREPDITVGLFRHFKEITIYEPNLSRIEMEDPKGLEVVLLLGAVVIREVYNSNMRTTFNITEPLPASSSTATTTTTCPISALTHPAPRRHQPNQDPPISSGASRPTQGPSLASQTSNPRPPPTDPRSQWEMDAETARLKKEVEQEERQRRHAEAAETKRVKRMLEEEERRAREKQIEIDRETERLKKVYAKEQKHSTQQLQPGTRPPAKPARHAQSHSFQPQYQQAITAYPPAPIRRPHSANPYYAQNLRPPQPTAQGPYLQPPGAAVSSSASFGRPSSSIPSNGHPSRPVVVQKKSFWGLKRGGDDGARLTKQRSTVF